MSDGHPSTPGVGALFLRPRRRGDAHGLGAGRSSALQSPVTRGTFLLHGDLHNHSDLSDGFGHAEDAFASMRAAGLDAAALTDHAGISDRSGALDPHLVDTLRRVWPEDPGMPSSLMGDTEYARAGDLAAAAESRGEFAAIRGFEWTTPHLGHINVWFSPTWTPVTDVTISGGVATLHDWLASAADEPDGQDILAGFNHPGRERLRFDAFRFDARLADRLVSLEMFNRDSDYLFEGVSRGGRSPLVDCLAAGWWPGLAGVSDEHSPRWGFEPGRGRTGLWVREWSRAGVREALAARRIFATREPGLRLDVVAAWARPGTATIASVITRGEAVRMGSRLGPVQAVAPDERADPTAVDLAVDLAGPGEWEGREVAIQVLTTGALVPEVVMETVGRFGSPIVVRTPVGGDDSTPWLVVRIADLIERNERPGPVGHLGNRRALAYASPIRLT